LIIQVTITSHNTASTTPEGKEWFHSLRIFSWDFKENISRNWVNRHCG